MVEPVKTTKLETAKMEPKTENPDIQEQKDVEDQKQLAKDVFEQFEDYVKLGLDVITKLPNHTETDNQSKSVEKTVTLVKTMLNNFMNISIEFKSFLIQLNFLMVDCETIQENFQVIFDLDSQLDKAKKRLENKLNELSVRELKMTEVINSSKQFAQTQLLDDVTQSLKGKDEMIASLKRMEEIDKKVKNLNEQWKQLEDQHNKNILIAKDAKIQFSSKTEGFSFLEETQKTQAENIRLLLDKITNLIDSNSNKMSTSNEMYDSERFKQFGYFTSQSKSMIENYKNEISNITQRANNIESQLQSDMTQNQAKINSTPITNREKWVKTNAYVEGQHWNRYEYYKEIKNLDREKYDGNKISLESAQRFNQENRDRNIDLAKKTNKVLTESLNEMNTAIQNTLKNTSEQSQESYKKLIEYFTQKKAQIQSQYDDLCNQLVETKNKKNFNKETLEKNAEELQRLITIREDERKKIENYLDEEAKNYKDEKENIKQTLEVTGHHSSIVFIEFCSAISLFFIISDQMVKYCAQMPNLIKEIYKKANLDYDDLKTTLKTDEKAKIELEMKNELDLYEKNYVLNWTKQIFPKNFSFQEFVEENIASMDALKMLIEEIEKTNPETYYLNKFQFSTLKGKFKNFLGEMTQFDDLKKNEVAKQVAVIENKFLQYKVILAMRELLKEASFPQSQQMQKIAENVERTLKGG